MAPATLPDLTRYCCRRSQLSPALKARKVMTPNQTNEALAIERMTPKAGSFIAPAKGGTIARTPGRKRLRTRPANPYFLYSFRIRCSAVGPAYFSIQWRNFFPPYRRPRMYVKIAPATFPTQPRKRTVRAEPLALLARKLPN